MAKRRGKRTVKKNVSSPVSNINGADPEEPPMDKKRDDFTDKEVERQIAAIRAIRDVEVEQLHTWLRLLRSQFSEEQQQTPVLQYFKENLPNLSVVNNREDGQHVVQWRHKDGDMSMNQTDGRNIHASLLHQLSVVYPDCSAAMPSFSGFEFSNKSVKASLLGADNPHIGNYVFEDPSNFQMLGLQDAFQTPGANSQRLSVGVTPKTLRLPKSGEMLLSVQGSPLGVYKEDHMEAIHESDEG